MKAPVLPIAVSRMRGRARRGCACSGDGAPCRCRGDALEAEQFQALARHLRIHTPQVRWKQGQAPMRRRLPRPLRAVILVFALAAALGTAAYGRGLRASLSPLRFSWPCSTKTL